MWANAILDELTTEEPATFDSEKYWTWGCRQQRERVTQVAEYCANHWQGDLCEIGCYTGGNTKRLAQVARRHGRRVIAIDPWIPGTQNCEGDECRLFLHNMWPYLDIVDIIRLRSQDYRAIGVLARTPLCFAVIDGLHTYEGCLSDIKAVRHAHVAMVDDALWCDGIQRAVTVGSNETGKGVIQHHLCREAYLI